MIIKRIQLKNIRSYENAEISFPQGSVLLSGDIGCGKTSVLLAIEFALFGLQPGQKGAALLRSQEKEGKVSLELEIDGKEILIERTLKRGKTISQEEAFITIDGDKKEMAVSELKNLILSLLDYPSEFAKKSNILYRFTVYTPQEEMKQIILETSETRLDTLRHVFGIDKYKRIKENAEIIRVYFRGEIKKKQGMIADLDEKKTRKSVKLEKIICLNSSLLGIEKELAKFVEQRKQAEQALKDVEEKIEEKRKIENDTDKTKIMLAGKKEALRSLEKDKEALSKQKEEIRDNLAKSKDLKELIEAMPSLKGVLSKIKESQVLLEKGIKETESKIEEKKKFEHEIEKTKILLAGKKEMFSSLVREQERIQQQIDEAGKVSFSELDILNLEKEKEECKKAVESLNSQNLEISSQISSLNLRSSEDEKLKSTISKIELCPTCLQDVDAVYRANITNKLESEISANKRKISELSDEKGRIISKLEELKKKSQECESRISELRFMKIKLEAVNEKKSRIIEIASQKSSIEKDFEMLEKHMENLGNSAFLLRKYDAVFEQKKKDLQDLISLEKENEMTITNNQKEIDRQTEQKSKITEKEIQIRDLESRKSAIDKDIFLLEKHIESLKSASFELAKYDLIFKTKESELEQARRSEKISEISLSNVKKEIEMINREIAELEGEIAEKEKIKESLAYLMSLQDWLTSTFLEVISFTEQHVMLKLRDEFSKLFNEWFNILVPEIFTVRLDDSFTPIIEQQDYELDYNFLSGGERTAIALAYRLALNQTINSLLSKIKTKDIVILDEPTDGFSEQQLDKMRDVLSQLKVKQLILVSHESKIESFVENIIKFRKEGGVTKVEA